MKTLNQQTQCGCVNQVQFSVGRWIAGFAVLAVVLGQIANAQINNDQCGGAMALPSCEAYTMSTAGATSVNDPLPTCQANFGKGV